ncbi:MAG: tryptophan--tRNA ligase [Spirochaetes bacterium]|nr:tryptophan--tRNA ligase [Spirochaetota bacterium]
MSRILSGIQPSGKLHIGNYFAMMKPMIEYQEEHELFCFIANYHAMTSSADGDKLTENTVEAAVTFLSLGLDPEKCFFWVQSDIPEVTQLTWILACHTSMGLLERSHSYKDKVAHGITPNAGLFTYPVLMAADILLYQSNLVPVGKDQKQHLEITRDIAQSFNSKFGETFVIPEPKISDDIAVIPGTDGQKMSKSYDNAIYIFEKEKELKKKIMRIVTDSTPVDEPKDPGKCHLFALYSLFADNDMTEVLRQKYLKGGIGYGEVKKQLFGLIWEYFAEAREKRNQMQNDIGEIHKILEKGSEKTREIAIKTLENVKKKVGLAYN